MRIVMLYSQLLDAKGEHRTIGGIQTYITNLAQVVAELGWEPVLYQFAEAPFVKEVGPLEVHGVPVSGLRSRNRKVARLVQAASREGAPSRDLLIFASDQLSIPVRTDRALAIQHGVAWDLPVEFYSHRRLTRLLPFAVLSKLRFAFSAVRSFENCANRVCVDYNFWNWYRTCIPRDPKGRIWVVPNCAASLPERCPIRPNDADAPIRILFARRFQPFRGTRLIADAAAQLLKTGRSVLFTLAGEGPDRQWLVDRFRGEPRVRIIHYLPEESLAVHLEHDIAVVPSVASEGTSLSLAEAMAAGCAVVSTPVGGMSNMVIDHHNGLLVMPDVNHLMQALMRLVVDAPLRQRLGEAAYQTAATAFSPTLWRSRWKTVLLELSGGVQDVDGQRAA